MFVRDAETYSCFYPKAVVEQSDGSAWDMEDLTAWTPEGGVEDEEEQITQIIT